MEELSFRYAEEKDVSTILFFIKELAAYEQMLDDVVATEELLKEKHAYVEPSTPNIAADPVVQYMSKAQMEKSIERTRKLMQEAAKKLEFIEAAQYRDELLKLEDLMKEKWG